MLLTGQAAIQLPIIQHLSYRPVFGHARAIGARGFSYTRMRFTRAGVFSANFQKNSARARA